jgi:hypothetical protein
MTLLLFSGEPVLAAIWKPDFILMAFQAGRQPLLQLV